MSIASISYRLLLLTVSVIAVRRYKKQSIPFKILSCAAIATLSLSISSYLVISRYKNNIPVQHVACISDYIFYSLTNYYLFKNKAIKKFIIVSIVLIMVFFFINALFLQPFFKVFPTYLYYPTQILFATFSLLLFKEMLMYPLKINIIKQSVFWYNTAMLFYATTMFFNMGLSNYLSQHNLSAFFVSFFTYFWYFILDVFSILVGISLLTHNKEIAVTDAR
jgi:hypothetical protein